MFFFSFKNVSVMKIKNNRNVFNGISFILAMSMPTPSNYDEIKVPFYMLGKGDFIEVKPGILEEIARKGGTQSSESFVSTKSGTVRISGYGIKSHNLPIQGANSSAS